MDMELREFVKQPPARFPRTVKMWIALALLALAAKPLETSASSLEGEVMADWRIIAFHCATDDRPPAFVSTVCGVIKRQVEDAARTGNVPLLHASDAWNYGAMRGFGFPMLVAHVSTNSSTEAAGIAIHVSLRAEQYFSGEVRTRRSAEPGDAYHARRAGGLVLWERRITGFVIGPNAARHLEAPMNTMVQEFFVTLLGARR